MCSICGVYNFGTSHPVEHDVILRMRDVAKHRGPNDSGIFCKNNIGLGHRRLSIIDLDTGHQPITNEARDIWVVYNGEIYNFQELRTELIEKGHIFSTKSDTEVVIHAYEEYGENCLDRLNGMFAFALWDSKKELLFLARDRVGIKPLHYCLLHNKIIFASEIKSILEHPEVHREIDFEALSQFLSFEYIPSPRTIFKIIKKLPAAHKLICCKGDIKIERYWDLYPFLENKIVKEESFYINKLYAMLEDSVKKALISDVPIGVFLSGGMDSSSITAIASTVSDKTIKTFSIGFDDKSVDELKFARIVANHFNTEHRELTIGSKSIISSIPSILNFLDEPFADASIIPTYIVSKLTKDYVTVALSGDGGDELFGGYATYQAHKLARFYQYLPHIFKNRIIKYIAKILPTKYSHLSLDFKIRKFIQGMDYPFPLRHFIWWGAYAPELKKDLLAENINVSLKRFDPYEIIFDYLSLIPNSCSELDKIMYLDLKLNLQDKYLTKVDRMSMANSLEVRVPLLNHDIIEFTTSIPERLKIKGFKTKYIFKKAMKKLLPKDILNKKKGGFDVPLGKWLRGELKGFVLDVLSPAEIKREGFFNYEFIKRILDEHFSGKKNNRQLIWPLVVFEFWYQRHM